MNSILIVDDEEDIRKMMAKLLGSHGYKTRLAADGQIALREIAQETPDIVLLDYNLPKMNGFTVLEEIRKIDEGITVIILTGYGSVDKAVQAMKLGAYDFITKPCSMDELLIILKLAEGNCSGRHRLMPPANGQ